MTVPEWVKDLRELIDRKPSRGDIQLLIGEMLSDRNDRGAALIAGGLVEGTMKAFIKARSIRVPASKLKRFIDQINVAYRYDWIDNDVCADLDRIRDSEYVCSRKDTNCILNSRHCPCVQGIPSRHD
jgi:hypothetical protein